MFTLRILMYIMWINGLWSTDFPLDSATLNCSKNGLKWMYLFHYFICHCNHLFSSMLHQHHDVYSTIIARACAHTQSQGYYRCLICSKLDMWYTNQSQSTLYGSLHKLHIFLLNLCISSNKYTPFLWIIC